MALPPPVPEARTDDLVVTETRDEVLVYDTVRNHIHHLNPIMAAVWRSCDGCLAVGEVAISAADVTRMRIEVDAARLALTKLEEASLLAGPLAGDDRLTRQSRRRFLRRAAVAGAVVPAIASVSVPAAAQAQSCNDTCVPWSECEFVDPGTCCYFSAGPPPCGTCFDHGAGEVGCSVQ